MTNLLAVCVLVIIATAGHAEKRLALVIGMNDYQEVPKLEKAVGDAQAMAKTLSSLGYQVTTALNLDRRNLNLALSKLYSSIEPGDTVLVHYSGHGVEIEGQNYLLPVDAPAPTNGSIDLLKAETLPLLQLVETLGEKGAGARILIVDACRDNPFAGKGKRSIGGTRGLANVATSKGTFIMYSAGAGQAALDRLGDADQEQTSVYMRVLIQRLATPNSKLRDLAASVRDEVEKLGKTVGHEQRPAYYDDLPENFSLVPATGAQPTQQPAIYVPPQVTQPEVQQQGISEEQAYKLAETINTIEGWNVFLDQHPNGNFAPYAKAAREKLVAASVSANKPKTEPQQQTLNEPATKSVPKPPASTCNGFGKVTGLNVNGDNFLSVRTGPAPSYQEIDRLYTGNGVKICGKQGRWLRIQYSGGKGWVHGRYIAR